MWLIDFWDFWWESPASNISARKRVVSFGPLDNILEALLNESNIIQPNEVTIMMLYEVLWCFKASHARLNVLIYTESCARFDWLTRDALSEKKV